MPLSNKIQELRDAVLNERLALAVMDKLYCEFVVKMLHYQTGKGDAPSLEEFSVWRESVGIRVEFARIRGLI